MKKPLRPGEHSIIIMPIHPKDESRKNRDWAAFLAESILMASNVSYHARMLIWVIFDVKAFQLHELIEPEFA